MAESSVALKRSSSFDLVRREIELTIKHAEGCLERFQENRESGEDLQGCIDCLVQLRGTFALVELQGGAVLCQEMVAHANEVPVGAMEDKNGLLATLSQALFVLRRYVDYFGSRREDHPELLIPIINELRQARRAKLLPDSYFFEIVFPHPIPVRGECLGGGGDIARDLRRLRHMYQVGLLDLLRGRDLALGQRLMQRAAQGFSRLCQQGPLGQFWHMVDIALRVMRDARMEVTVPRKRLFMRVERYARELVHIGKVAATRNASETLVKELLYLIALSAIRDEETLPLLNRYKVAPLDLDEQKLIAHRSQLMGPGSDVLRSLAMALREELAGLKDKLDILERSLEFQEADYVAIADELARLAATLVMLNLNKLAQRLREQETLMRTWAQAGRPPQDGALLSVADAVLAIEQAAMQLGRRGITQETDMLAVSPRREDKNAYLGEALAVVFAEAQGALLLTKRAIAAFVESGGDRQHLENVPAALQGIWGSLMIIEATKAADLVTRCAQYIKSRLIESEVVPDEHSLETLADALTSLEYYLERFSKDGVGNEELLTLAEESLSCLGLRQESYSMIE